MNTGAGAIPADVARQGRALKLFIVAGEHSGDALGAKLMAALRAASGSDIAFAGVGGEQMQAEGLRSLFPLADIAVMGPIAILKRLPSIVRRVYQTIGAAVAFGPDAMIIIDAPEFTHAVAKRIRRRRPDIPIIDYVSPTVWAWRPGRARAMRPYVDHLLALLPFEPEAHQRLDGPPCSYVGHPLLERLDWIDRLDTAPLIEQLGIDAQSPVLVLLPGSRESEINRLIDVFGESVAQLGARGLEPVLLMPVVTSSRALIEDKTSRWRRPPHLVEGEDDKWRAFKLARAALAASGTVTLELALAGVPSVVAYKVEPIVAPVLRRMIGTDMAALANHVLGEMVYPELIQEDCTAARLCAGLAALLDESDARARQLAALARVRRLMAVPGQNPSAAAAEIVMRYAAGGRD